jgi:hypothetical protein
MKPYKMIAAEGEPGDCLRTAIACLLEIGPVAVPHFTVDDDVPTDQVWRNVDAWLATQGMTAWFAAYPGEVPLDQVLLSVASLNPDKYYIVGGRGYLSDHVVIALNDKIVHDPARLGGGLSGPNEQGFWMILTLASDKVVKR